MVGFISPFEFLVTFVAEKPIIPPLLVHFNIVPWFPHLFMVYCLHYILFLLYQAYTIPLIGDKLEYNR